MNHLGDMLSAFLDGQLDAEERGRVMEHLSRCQVCRDELDEVAAARAAVRGLPSIEPTSSGLGAEPARPARLGTLARAAAAVVAVVVGVGALAALATPDPIPATDLSVLFAAYSSEGSEVASYVPVTSPSARSKPKMNIELPDEVAGLPLQDARNWGDDGTVGYYEGSDSAFVLLDSRRPIDTEEMVGVQIRRPGGESYLGSWGPQTIMYVWETSRGWMALLGRIEPEIVDEVLADLPLPADPGLLTRAWRDLIG